MNAISGPFRPEPTALVVGLVNNMAPAGQRTADAQFGALLHAAAEGQAVHIRRFAPGVAELPDYEPIEALWGARLDGLIVTGAEPQAGNMQGEPSWPFLARLVDWAAEHTDAAIWSCLAAHAAVYRLDGLPRRRLPEKLSGLFACRPGGPHALMDGAAASYPVPHSRFNDLEEAALAARGYDILSQGLGPPAADAFAKRAGRSLFLMLQGHPEYAADTLRREYRRDLRRWISGDYPTRPLPPSDYFDAKTRALLQDAEHPRCALETLEAATLPPPLWQAEGVRLVRSWLGLLRSDQPAAITSSAA